MKRTALLAVALLALTGCGGGSGGATASIATPTATPSTSAPTTSAPAAVPTTTPPSAVPLDADPPFLPDKDDFELEIDVKEKSCFGSAGCNIEYAIELAYLGDTSTIPDDATGEITYEITGGEDEAIGTIEFEGAKYEEVEDFMSTSSSNAKLKATIIEVEVDEN